MLNLPYSGKYAVKMYLVGTRFLFELPVPSQLSKVWLRGRDLVTI